MSTRPRRILFLHNCDGTTIDIVWYHLQGFAHLDPDSELYFHNLFAPITGELRSARFDALIVNFEALAVIRLPDNHERFTRKYAFLKDTCAVRIAITMDDYTAPGYLEPFLLALGIQYMHTPLPDHVGALYPNLVGKMQFRGALTGYLDQPFVDKAEQFSKPWDARTIYFGNRIRYLHPEYGRWARMKGEMNERFGEILRARGHYIDLSFRYEDRIEGDDWIRFLGDMKFMVNPQGGCSVIDRYLDVSKAAVRFREKNPDATFEETEAACFPGLDGEHIMKASGPRLIQSIVCGTVQVIPTDEYPAGLEPMKHYIPLEIDFSNIDDALAIMADEDRCQEIAAAARAKVMSSPEIWFDSFIRGVLSDIPEVTDNDTGPSPARQHIQEMHDLRRRLLELPEVCRHVFRKLMAECSQPEGVALVRAIQTRMTAEEDPASSGALLRISAELGAGLDPLLLRRARYCAAFILGMPSPKIRRFLERILFDEDGLRALEMSNADLTYCMVLQNGCLVTPNEMDFQSQSEHPEPVRAGMPFVFGNRTREHKTDAPLRLDVDAEAAVLAAPEKSESIGDLMFTGVFLYAGRRRPIQKFLVKQLARIQALDDRALRERCYLQIARYFDLEQDTRMSRRIIYDHGLQDHPALQTLSWWPAEQRVRKGGSARGALSLGLNAYLFLSYEGTRLRRKLLR